ncbi:efflux RND transporter periplasmic adaptor subunit [Candidatus Nitrospira bockiana]
MRRALIIGGLLATVLVSAVVLVLDGKDGGTVEKKAPADRAAPPEGTRAGTPRVTVVPVIEQRLEDTVRLPGELHPYLTVDLYPKVTGILEWIGVDRGSTVKRGQVLVRLAAPELSAQRAEAEAKLQAARITYGRLKTAAASPGVVAPNDLEIAKRTVEAERARVQSLKDMEAYLVITAPFDGVVTTRTAHPGALVGPGSSSGTGANLPLLRIEQVAHLRLMVPVPEQYTGTIGVGQRVRFSVPAFPDRTFEGTISRVAHSVDVKTRTMPVEMDVDNADGLLAPGMFPQVEWPVRRASPTLFVPAKSVAVTTELTFVLRVRDDTIEWVKVQKGQSMGSLIEVFGDLRPGDAVVERGTDELRPGTKVSITTSES